MKEHAYITQGAVSPGEAGSEEKERCEQEAGCEEKERRQEEAERQEEERRGEKESQADTKPELNRKAGEQPRGTGEWKSQAIPGT
ncbi:hypothetical protein NDU88_006399 [Pleurodeles waltl]|uniref:Uncharacterized protein n=1 Tax=Pleurodeles waltl TaxID=8319 RepID=A0AAV7UKV9_PLEWA|nr:hypothetical protein NDU88_006399 [Pleurodeles waltl]